MIAWRRRDRAFRARLVAQPDQSGQCFDGAHLADVDLRANRFRAASFLGADLTAADLRGVDLRHADLRRARLTGARLDGADLRGARLDGATLIATEMRGAWIEGASAEQVIYDQATVWPDGFRPPRPEVGLWHGARWPRNDR